VRDRAGSAPSDLPTARRPRVDFAWERTHAIDEIHDVFITLRSQGKLSSRVWPSWEQPKTRIFARNAAH
jgi:hypothetical protein